MDLLATVLKPDGHSIGRYGLYPFLTNGGVLGSHEASIAFYLDRRYWGRGLATEAGRALVARGLCELGPTPIHAGINAQNKAALRVVENLGFRLVRSGEGGGSRWHDFALVSPDQLGAPWHPALMLPARGYARMGPRDFAGCSPCGF
jgi:RimJ/RimL family protein N-acetyltransferase